MPIIYSSSNKTELTQADIKALKFMLRGSFQNHVRFFDGEKAEGYSSGTTRNVNKSARIITNAFQEAINNLNQKVDNAASKTGSITAEDLISDIQADIIKKLDRDLTEARDKREISKRELTYAKDFIRDFGSREAVEFSEYEMRREDTEEGYEFTENKFKLATEPIPGIADIAEYNPARDRVQALYSVRSGNSGTLKNSVEDSQKELEKNKEGTPEYEIAEKNLQEAAQSITGLHAGGEAARMFSSELMAKDRVTFGDLYSTFSGLNKFVRTGDKEGGDFRADAIGTRNAEGESLDGVGSFTASKTAYKTLSKIADTMNTIKQTKDPALRKTQAVQLAAFANSMLISEHLFGDGNGRTCRLFADTILQSFGLPPHTPNEKMMNVAKTMGKEMDFNKATNLFMSGIKKSDELLKQERERQKSLPGEKARLNSQISSLETSVEKTASEAKEMLAALESMKKEGHKNGQDYIEMHDALEDVSNLDPKEHSIENIERVLKNLDTAAKQYQKSHTGLFVATKGYGTDRLDMSKKLQKFSTFRQDVIKGWSKDLDKNAPISSQRQAVSEVSVNHENKGVERMNMKEFGEKKLGLDSVVHMGDNKNKKTVNKKQIKNKVENKEQSLNDDWVILS